MEKPQAFNNNWLGNTVISAQLQIIDGDVWKTIGYCIDTPNAIRDEIAKSKYKGLSLWLKTGFGRRPLF